MELTNIVTNLVTVFLFGDLPHKARSCQVKFTKEPLVGYRCEPPSETAVSVAGLSQAECTAACVRRKHCRLQNYVNNMTKHCLLFSTHCTSSKKDEEYVIRAFHPHPDRHGCLTWVPFSGTFPTLNQGAVIHQSTSKQAVGRGTSGSAVIPGKLFDNLQLWSAYGGNSFRVTENVEMLIIEPSCSVVWVSYLAAQGQQLPLNAVVGGRDGDGTALYVARGQHQNDEFASLGYYHPLRDSLVISNDGIEFTRHDMEILIII